MTRDARLLVFVLCVLFVAVPIAWLSGDVVELVASRLVGHDLAFVADLLVTFVMTLWLSAMLGRLILR